jgi:hypothetical protein
MPVHNVEVRSARANCFPGLSLVEGEMIDDDQAQIVTCNLGAFDAYMRTIYADWDAFTDWALERTGRYGRWWELPEVPGHN